MKKKIIRLTESDLERLVNKIIKEEKINELGDSDFENTEDIDVSENNSKLRAAISKLKGRNHVVVIDNDDKIVGYGPTIDGMSKNQVCKIAQSLIEDWEGEYNNMNEIDQPDFGGIKPITFCEK